MQTRETDMPMAGSVVKNVDKAAGKLSVSHGCLLHGMSGMALLLGVKDATWPDQVKDGDQIRFVADNIKG